MEINTKTKVFNQNEKAIRYLENWKCIETN